MSICKGCDKRTITCKETCPEWKKEEFFAYLAKRKKMQDKDTDGFLLGNARERKHKWNRSNNGRRVR